MRLALVMTPVPVTEPAVVAVVAVEAATFVSNEPLRAGRNPEAVVWTSCETPLNVLPAVVMLAVVTPLTAVADNEPPESVAPSKVVAPVMAPLRARLVSVPTEVMLVYAVTLLRFAFVMTPTPVMDPAVVAVETVTFVSSEPFNAGRNPEAVVWTSCETPLTAVAESEPPEMVAVLNVPPVTAPVTARVPSVPTDVMFV